ncbi:amidohydrolase 2 [Collybia nuda]|uniref:Amidohydrolase 2 n=1 Tax=Collybia nuda TaxID=64659 RepID=A0A9P5Y7R6_9AGAR|nr:amidohydrolase 2 [Collybia nuda]
MEPERNQPEFPQLYKSAFTYPAIDNHAHPLLRPEHRDHIDIPFDGVISEAGGVALQDSIHTLACYRAASQLSELYQLEGASWNDVKTHRSQVDYIDLCKQCIKPTGIQCILLDDGLGLPELAADYTWHDQFTHSPTRRIVRIEVVAEGILTPIIKEYVEKEDMAIQELFDTFSRRLSETLTRDAIDTNVAGFKSIICYRSGLDVYPLSDLDGDILRPVLALVNSYIENKGRIRLNNKFFNDYVVRTALAIAVMHNKPVQFHTGLGDDDISLRTSSPSHLQPLIKAYPKAIFVLLHSSYPYTREAGYLTSVYRNVYLDFGEVFPFVSGEGQRSIIKQVIELSPTNKILWSTDGHWWPESYYLGTVQARQALYQARIGSYVFSDVVRSRELTEAQAVHIVESALFHNANAIYNLGLEPYQGP